MQPDLNAPPEQMPIAHNVHDGIVGNAVVEDSIVVALLDEQETEEQLGDQFFCIQQNDEGEGFFST